jgi:hypothetical protein
VRLFKPGLALGLAGAAQAGSTVIRVQTESAGLYRWRKRRAAGALLCLLLLAGSARAQPATEQTLVLTNENGLIDKLIASGHGSQNLYTVLQFLQPSSGGVIPPAFMAKLAGVPPGSEVFTAALSNFAGLNNPVCVNGDGTFGIQPVFARDYWLHTGYNFHTGAATGVGNVLFLYALNSGYYIDAGERPGGGRYQAFAIVSGAEDENTIVLTNEGGLIDQLIAAGYGSRSLYAVLQYLEPYSGGAITPAFMAKVVTRPPGSDIFTAVLSNYTGINNPIGVNSDGTLDVLPIFGAAYQGQTGYTTYAGSPPSLGTVRFTSAISPQYYIDTGSSVVSVNTLGSYTAFAIIWGAPPRTPNPIPLPPSAVLVLTGLASAGLYHWRKRRAAGALLCLLLLAGHLPAQTVAHTIVVTNEGGLIDKLIAAGRGAQSLYTVLQALQPDSYGFISANFMAELAATSPASEARTVPLSNFAGANNPVGVNNDGTLIITASFGRDYVGRTGWTYHTGGSGTSALGIVVFGNASTPAYHQVLESCCEAIAIVWSLPVVELSGVVLSNEGGLIDRLVAGGYGSRPVYEALQHLQPLSQGAISQDFMTQLAAAPHSRDVFTAELYNFTSIANNPVLISPDGEMLITAIYGRDYRGRAGFQTASGTSAVAGTVLFTSASSPQYYIDAGSQPIIEAGRAGSFHYKATAIVYADPPPTPNPIPVPPSAILVVTGLAGAALYQLRKRRAAQSGLTKGGA